MVVIRESIVKGKRPSGKGDSGRYRHAVVINESRHKRSGLDIFETHGRFSWVSFFR